MRQFIADVHNRSEEGATAAEYVFLIVFVAIVVSVGMAALGTSLSGLFSETKGAVDTVNGGTTIGN